MRIVGKIVKWLGFGVYALCAIFIVMFLTPIGGWKALDVLTGSMRPTIQPGALVLIHRVPLSSVKVGNIVTYTNPRNFKQTITHRVIRIQKINGVTTITVKGDANPFPDRPFPGGLIDGRVTTIIPGVGRDISALHNPYVLASIIIIPGLFIIWSEIIRLRRVLAQKPPAPESTESRESVAALASIESIGSEIERPALTPTRVSKSQKLTSTEKTQPRRIRSMDGMNRFMIAGLVAGIALLAIGHTYALPVSVGNADLTGNLFSVVTLSPTPTATSCNGAAAISYTGSASTNNVTSISNTNEQNAESGISTAASGASTNANSTTANSSNTN
jgi:signal peptidase